MNQQPNRDSIPLWRLVVGNVARGFLMGGADVIPGVSGGTIALILGIYARLVGAISNFDLELLSMLRSRRWRDALAHVDLVFLLTLLAGIAIGIVSLAGTMHELLTDSITRPLTLAAFFGLIIASGVLVAKLVKSWTPLKIIVAVAFAAGAFYVTGLQGEPVEPSLWYVFLCGMIAICAMILPGISGAFILLLLGTYVHITGSIKNLPKGEITTDNVLTVAVFCCGCGIGLLVFSKFLKWLLARHESITMAALAGLIFGSLRKVWPFQHDLTPEVTEFSKKVYEPFLPSTVDAQMTYCAAIAIAASAAVFALEWWSSQRAALNKAEGEMEA